MNPNGAYLNIDGLDVYYEVHGTGRPLVLLHGGVLSIDLSFGAMLPELAATRQVIAVDLQGHGRTADSTRELTVDNLAGDVIGLLDHLGIEQADLYGYSLGGSVALHLAIRHAERVGRVVLAATHFRADGYYPEITDPALQATSNRLPTQADFQEWQETYARVAPDPGHFMAFLPKVSAVPGTVAWTDDDLRSITAPVLLVIGDNDFVRIEHAAQMHALIPDTRLAVLPGCNHMDLNRRADLLLPLVEQFFAGQA